MLENTCVVLPSYKPPAEFIGLVESLSATTFGAILVVDDSGPAFDALFERVRQIPKVEIVRRSTKSGKGSALKEAFRYVARAMPNCKALVTADADGQHLPTDIQRVAEASVRQPNAVVIGSRTFGKNTPFRSKIGNSLSCLAARVLIGLSLKDTTSGLRGMSVATAVELSELPHNGYEYELDMLVACKHKNIPIAQVPIETVYIDDNSSSHFNPIADSLKIYGVLSRFVSSVVLATLFNVATCVIAFAATSSQIASIAVGQAIAWAYLAYAMQRFIHLSGQPTNRTAALSAALASAQFVVVAATCNFAKELVSLTFAQTVVLAQLALLPIVCCNLREVLTGPNREQPARLPIHTPQSTLAGRR